jgi:hypothetical protein
MNAAAAEIDSKERSNARALFVLGAVTFVVFLGDALFWRAEPGVSIGLFALTLGGLCLALQSAVVSWRIAGFGAMLLVSCAQTAVEISLSNVIAIVVLLMAIVGRHIFDHCQRERRGWLRRRFPFSGRQCDTPLSQEQFWKAPWPFRPRRWWRATTSHEGCG